MFSSFGVEYFVIVCLSLNLAAFDVINDDEIDDDDRHDRRRLWGVKMQSTRRKIQNTYLLT